MFEPPDTAEAHKKEKPNSEMQTGVDKSDHIIPFIPKKSGKVVVFFFF
jgi:hypothetical protein